MTIESFDVVFYTSIFILPGFIIKGIINSMSPPKKFNESLYVFQCLSYSICHCAVWSWLYKIIYPLHKSHPNWYWIILVAITLIGASVIAVIVGLIKQKRVINWIANKLNINFIDPTPAAWDYYFSKQEPVWVIITLTDDKTIMGLFADKSFASSDPDERDIYIEEIYDIDKNDVWQKNDKSNGIYIPKDMIKTIEFLKVEGGEF